MKLRLAAVCPALFLGSVLSVMAGDPAPASGVHIETVPNTAVASGQTMNSAGTSVSGTGATQSAGSSASAGAFSNSSAGTSGAASSNGTSAGGFSNGGVSSSSRNNGGFEGPSRPAPGASNIALEITREKVIDTGDKTLGQEKTGKGQSTDKTFAPGLLESVSEISALQSRKTENPGATQAGPSKSAATEANDESKKKD